MAYRKRIAGAKGDKSHIQELSQAWAFEAFEIEEERRWLGQRGILRKAERLYLSMPPFGNESYWEEAGATPGRHFLTAQGMNDVLARIRAERKARIEVWAALAPLISAVTALLGVIVAMLALLSRR